MAEPEEGTYVVISVASSKAMDVQGASDKAGANVFQWGPNYLDAEIWAFVKPEDEHFQIMCSLTGKCLDVLNADLKSGTNVRQWSDNNGPNAQRWVVETDGGTFSFKGKTYDTYTIKPARATNLALDVAGAAVADRTNIRLYTANNSNAQRWILYPIPVLTEGGTYRIALADDPTMCVDVPSASTANNANIQVYSNNDSDAQVFKAEVDPESFLVRLYAACSDKVLDIAGNVAKSGTNVIQYTAKSGDAGDNQWWLPIQKGSIKVDGQTVPVYELAAKLGSNLCLDYYGGKNVNKTNVQVYTRNNSKAQKFAFIKNERLGASIEKPGSIDQTEFSRTGVGTVTVQGLTFTSKQKSFQARYMIRRYKKGRASYTDSAWMNVEDDSTSRSGWGQAWSSTFDATPVNGVITIPFSKDIELDSTYQTADVIMEVRTYIDSYGSGYKAHGPVMQSTIKVLQRPTVSVSSVDTTLNSSGNFAISTSFKDSLGNGCSYMRSRIVDANRDPVSEWKSGTEMYLSHGLPGTLVRLPEDGETLYLEYSMLTNDGLTITGSLEYKFSYASGMSFNPSVTYIDDDSCRAVVTSKAHTHDLCFVEVPDEDGNKIVECELLSEDGNNKSWVVLPPLNRDAKIIIIGSNDGSKWGISTTTCRIRSHLFIWNWTETIADDAFSSSAAIIVNPDNPPAQSRGYTTDLKFSAPAGRRYPVGFSSINLTANLSIEGVVIDEDAVYQSAEPLPQNVFLPRVKKLIRLSGKGIHPVYRTPYGDWYQVGIESIDISKKNLNYSTAIVTQRAVED